jgi:hypothetical protein
MSIGKRKRYTNMSAYMRSRAMSESETVRWTFTVSKETDIALRTFLGKRGLKKGDLSRFVEDAVRWQVFRRTVQDARARNAGVPAKELNAAVEDALAAVRAERFRAAG